MVKFHEKLLYRKKKEKQNNIPQKKDKLAKQGETKISIWKWAKRYQENVTILIRKSQSDCKCSEMNSENRGKREKLPLK